MTRDRGPTRIVLIQSGRYAYAELELHEPLHLIAGNNVGKTTLIAALQFLYIDDIKSMRFSQGPVETRRHYFPHLGSLVLFECLTPSGYQVVGARGLGPAKANEFERFVCMGEFDRTDYVDGRQVRTWEEISRRLVAKEVYFPDTRAYRSSVLGTETKRPSLDIVPLARTGSYENFRFLFRNLLHLSHIDEKQLRSLLIDVAGLRVTKTEVDLRKEYAELFEQLEREARDVRALRRLQLTFERLAQALQRRDELRASLAARWLHINALIGVLRSTTTAECLRREERARTINETDRPSAEAKRKAEEEALAEVNRNLGITQAGLQRIDELRQRVGGFMEDLEESLRRTLGDDCDGLATRLRAATDAAREDVAARLGELRRVILVDERAEVAFERVAATWLRTNADLTQAALDDAFRILNPALLGMVVEGPDVTVVEPGVLVGYLRELAAGFKGDGFVGAGVRLSRSILPAGSPLEAFADVQAIRERLRVARREVEVLTALLADVDDRDALAATLRVARTKLSEAEGRFRTWGELREAESMEPGLRAREGERKAGSIAAAARLKVATERVSGFAEELRQLEQDNGVARRAEEQRLVRVRRLIAPPIEWEMGALLSNEGDDLLAHVEAYRAEAEGQASADEQLRTVLSELEVATEGRYARPSEAETLAALRDVRQALPNREAELERYWGGLVDGLGGNFEALLGSADEVHREVTKLNSALGKRRISDLQSVEVEYAPDEGLIVRIRAFLKRLGAPLLSSLDEHQEASPRDR